MSPFKEAAPWDVPGQDVQQPLLPINQLPPTHHQRQQQQPCRNQPSQRAKQQQQDAAVDLGGRFLQRLWRIMYLVNAAPALSLVLLSLAETVIVSKIGTISGLFYQVFVDGQAAQVPHLMLWSAGCYTATALFYSFKSGLQDFFAWRWRASLTLQLQRVYCSSVGDICPRSKAPLLQSLDSPDQRVAQDLPLLTASLSEVLTQLAAVPFNIFWYTHLTHQVFGSWVPVGCAYLFFLAGLVLQRLVMLPVASAVFQQEAAEGAFRYGHTRFRAWAGEIAMYRSAAVEQQHLEGQLARVLVCQGRLMLRRAVLTATSRLLDYSGLVVNFGCLAAAVFGGAWSGAGQSAGDIASKVSVASFYLLTLIYNFSQVLDLASKVANLAGLTARVSQMLEALPQHGTARRPPPQQRQQQYNSNDGDDSSNSKVGNRLSRRLSSRQTASAAAAAQDSLYSYDTQQQDHQHSPHSQHSQQQQQPLQEVVAGKSPSHQRYASQAVLLQEPQLLLLPPPTPGSAAAAAAAADCNGATSSSPTSGSSVAAGAAAGAPSTAASGSSSSSTGAGSRGSGADDVMQVSIHSMGADMLLQEVRRAFPDSPRLAPLLAVLTFQFCGTARTRMLQQLQQQREGAVVLAQPAAPGEGRPASGSGGDGSEGVAASSSCCSPCAAGSGGCGGPAQADGSDSSSQHLGLCGDADMQHMLSVFMTWQQVVFEHITSRGYWCDTIDPRTGTALHSTPGSHYDEVIGASVLLGYDRVTPLGQAFSLISHPEAATQVYPATLFTSAPLQVVRGALRAAAGAQESGAVRTQQAQPRQQLFSSSQQPPLSPAAHSSSGSSAGGANQAVSSASDAALPKSLMLPQQQLQQLAALLLSSAGLRVCTPSGVAVVQGLSLEVAAGASLLIQGPSGCGKSTLVSCLAGLWPPEAGTVRLLGGTHTPGTAVAAASTTTAPGAMTNSSSSSSGSVGDLTVLGVPAGVMFVPQRPLAAPGTTLRQQVLYPAAAGMWPCSCVATSSNSSGPWASSECERPLGSAKQQGRRRQRRSSSSWWLDWLSCGLHRQQQQYGSASETPSLVAPAAPYKQQQQQHSPNPLCPTCQALMSVLSSVGLSYLLAALPAGLHTRQEAWGDVLSPGELQRLTFARVLLHRPCLAVLDEATSALPGAVAVQLYRQLQAAGVSYLSVGHSSCLVEVHDRVLSIAGDGGGGWRLS